MLAKRIIPCLDVTAGRVVKGVNFQNLRDAGDPVEAAKRYSDAGADELVFLDITATLEARVLAAIERRTVPSQEDVVAFYRTHERQSWSLSELLDIAASRPAYGGPVYVAEPAPPPPPCYWQRQRYWDGYGWVIRPVRVCY